MQPYPGPEGGDDIASSPLLPGLIGSQPVADKQLVAALAAANFEGPLWRQLEERLARYGMAVVGAWLGNGRIFSLCSRIGRPVARPSGDAQRLWDEDLDVRRELTVDTVVSALEVFEQRLADGQWNASEASLTTYFVGACLRSFPNVYRRWLRSTARQPDRVPLAAASEHDAASATSDPAAIVASRDATQRMVAMLPTDVQKIVTLRATGYTNAEIAIELGLTTKVVEGRLRRIRKRHNAVAAPNTST